MRKKQEAASGDDRIVRAVDIERSFGSGEKTVHVLRGADLDVREGELVALYGPSGSGKTTLLNIVGSLDRPDAGQLEVCGRDVLRMSDSARTRMRRNQLGFIFQNYTLLPTYSAQENIDLGLRLAGINFLERRRRTRAVLDAVGLSAWSDHVPEELSGGQRQRVAIARALALRPQLILADEPTSGIDTPTARRILALFQGIAARQGTAFLIVSHDPMVTEFVDHAFDLIHGRLEPRARQDPMEALKDHAVLQD